MPGRPAQRPLATRPVARGGLDHLTEYRQARSWLRHEADPCWTRPRSPPLRQRVRSPVHCPAWPTATPDRPRASFTQGPDRTVRGMTGRLWWAF